jgi:hypothetical protein
LILVSILAIGIAALLTFADTSIRATVGIRAQGATAYAADGAVQAAIQSIRNNASLGIDPQFTGNVNNCTAPSVGLDGVTPSVTCIGMTNSGQPGGGVNNSSNTPGYAIVLLGTSVTETGFSQGSTNTVQVNGSVYDNSTMSVNPGTLKVSGTVQAHSTCNGQTIPPGSTGNIVASQGTTCTASVPVMADPGNGSSSWNSNTLPTNTVTTMPGCSGGVATFVPGIYANPTTLATAINRSCKSVFPPGTYYFNFPGDGSVAQLSLGNKANIIGGTLAAGGNTCDATKPGVQFIFGGASQIVANNSTIILCATPPTPTQQSIAIYGLQGAGQSGCVVQVGGCALLSTNGSQMDLTVTGTVYTPQDLLSLSITNSSQQIAYRGIVARSLAVQFTASVPPGVPNIQVPTILGSGSAANRKVLFTATINAQTKLSAVAVYDDSDPSKPGKGVTVTSWSVNR